MSRGAGFLKSLALLSGHYRRRLEREIFPGVAVLCYHGLLEGNESSEVPFQPLHVTTSEFEKHLRFLTAICNPIGLTDWLDCLAGLRTLPPRPILVTFDDGYRSVFKLAKPLLEKHEVPALVFVASEPVARRTHFWHDAVALVVGEAEVEKWKTLPHDEWRKRCDSVVPIARISDEHPCAPMRIEEVAQLGSHPLFEIGGHTANHAILARATDERQRLEIESNHQTLLDWTGSPPRAFAYPNGRPRLDFTDSTIQLVREAGYRVGFTTKHGFSAMVESDMERSRLLMLSGITDYELAHRLAYSWRVKTSDRAHPPDSGETLPRLPTAIK